jgi:hypothetical protein
MPLPWSVEILPETIVLGLAMAISASILGAWIGARLSADDLPYSETSHLRPYAVVAAVAIFAMLAFPLFTKTTTDVRADVVLTNADSGAKRTVNATVTLTPRDAAEHANWFTMTSWQGGGHLITDRLERVAEGVYRTTQPVPVYGEWKTMLRLHEGRSILGLPVYAPEDKAIPVPAVTAPARFSREFLSDKELLQREAKTNETWITYGAYGTVLAFALGLLGMLAWGLHRVGTTAGVKRDTPIPEWALPPEPLAEIQREHDLITHQQALPEWARPPGYGNGNGNGSDAERATSGAGSHS